MASASISAARRAAVVSVEKYGLPVMDALASYLESETYRMFNDPSLVMEEFSPLGIFDMWESERVTGDPRNSLYLRRDEIA